MDFNKAFLLAAKESGSYLKSGKVEPAEISKKYKDALRNLQVYLDMKGLKMPAPKYHYDNKDVTTWKYLDVRVSGDKYNGHVLNPTFRCE